MHPHILLCGHPYQFPNYENALVQAGAVVRFLPVEACDGLLLPGGGDILPRFYGAEQENCQGIDEERDERELRLCRAFIAAGKPVFGICRGLQILNVALGGTLCQHVEGHSGTDGRDGFHLTSVRKGSFLESLYGKSFAVNTAHHQALGQLGHGLCPVQWTEDGVVEGVSHTTLPLWGVQWHPERLSEGGKYRDTVAGEKLFDFFILQCS